MSREITSLPTEFRDVPAEVAALFRCRVPAAQIEESIVERFRSFVLVCIAHERTEWDIRHGDLPLRGHGSRHGGRR